MYINDLVNKITWDKKLFADDTTLYIQVSDHQQSVDLLNYNLQQVEFGANQWLVNFNPSQTKLMSFNI